MAKAKKTVFFCQSCGYESAKWSGQCPACHEWNTFVEEVLDDGRRSGKRDNTATRPVPLSEITSSQDQRIGTGMEELDRVLGGGIVTGSLVLVGGDPGIGKSTLLLQVCQKLSERHIQVLYVSGEESLQQIKIRADRIGPFTMICRFSVRPIWRIFAVLLRRKNRR